MKICIVGGGSIGVLTSALLSKNPANEVHLLVSDAEGWNKKLYMDAVYERDKFSSEVHNITSNAEEAVRDAKVVIITVPSYGVKNKINLIKDFVEKDAFVGVMPGTGGAECYLKEFLDKGNVVFGTQRVIIAGRTSEKGKQQHVIYIKDELKVAAIPTNKTEMVCNVLDEIFSIKCTRLSNYLEVTLVPSNPILHPSRLYGMFKDCMTGKTYNKDLGFYSDWDDVSSEVCIALDKELMKIVDFLKGLGIDFSGLKNIREHYGVATVKEFTKKITSIPTWQHLKADLIENENGEYVPNKETRYFQEDFEYGLFIIKSFGEICNIDTPMIDEVIDWAGKLFNKEYFVNGKFIGKDLKDLPLPQNFGINTVEDIIDFYSETK